MKLTLVTRLGLDHIQTVKTVICQITMSLAVVNKLH